MLIDLKRKYKLIPCSDMQKGDIGIVIIAKQQRYTNILIIKASNNFVNLKTGDAYGNILNNDYPDWSVKLLEPGTELIIK